MSDSIIMAKINVIELIAIFSLFSPTILAQFGGAVSQNIGSFPTNGNGEFFGQQPITGDGPSFGQFPANGQAGFGDFQGSQHPQEPTTIYRSNF